MTIPMPKRVAKSAEVYGDAAIYGNARVGGAGDISHTRHVLTFGPVGSENLHVTVTPTTHTRRRMNMSHTYRKKPVEIEARQFVGDTAAINEVYLWIESNTLGSFEPLGVIEGREPCPASGVSIDPRDGRMMIATLEGPHHANLGDWIIRGVKGEFYPCKPDIFEATYEAES